MDSRDEQPARLVAGQAAGAALAPAGLWPRVKAFGFDYLFIAAYLIVLTGAVWGLRLTPLRSLLASLYGSPSTAQLTDSLLFDVPVMLYFALFESSVWQATPGKRRLGLRVVTESGQRLSLTRALGRIILKFLPWEIAHTSIWQTPGWPLNAQPTTLNIVGYVAVYVLIGVYLVTLLTSGSRQTLYDRLTQTRVISTPAALRQTRQTR
ncbi:MAG TPA: RDD family protein [Ktedonobacterales bacterium]